MSAFLLAEEPDAGSGGAESSVDGAVGEALKRGDRQCGPVGDGVEAVLNLDVVAACERLAAIALHLTHVVAVGGLGVVA